MIHHERRSVLKAAASAGALLSVGGVGTAVAREGRRKGASAENTILEIVATDVEASNGVAHVIDGVLLP